MLSKENTTKAGHFAPTVALDLNGLWVMGTTSAYARQGTVEIVHWYEKEKGAESGHGSKGTLVLTR